MGLIIANQPSLLRKITMHETIMFAPLLFLWPGSGLPVYSFQDRYWCRRCKCCIVKVLHEWEQYFQRQVEWISTVKNFPNIFV